MNDLQPLVNGRLEPVMEASQGQHFSVPVKKKEKKSSFSIKAEPGKGWKRDSSLLFQSTNRAKRNVTTL